MQHNMIETLNEAWSDAWDQGSFENFEKLLHPEYSRQSSSSGNSMNSEELLAEIKLIRDAFPDIRTEIENILVDGEHVAVFWKSFGTFTQPLGDVPPTGRQVETRGTNLMTLKDDQIFREKVTWDAGELLADLGVSSFKAAFEMTPPPASTDDIDQFQEQVRGFNRQFITGVTVVTTLDNETPKGLAVNSYASVSFDPPLVMVCIQKTSSTYPAMFKADHFGINILATDQSETLTAFASKNPNKFDAVEWSSGPQKSPLLSGSAATLEVEIVERVQVKTHTAFIGRVIHAETSSKSPIIYKAGKFYDGENLKSIH